MERRKLEMLEKFNQTQREKFRDKLRKLRAFEAGLDGLEKKLKLKLNEMQKRERKISKTFISNAYFLKIRSDIYRSSEQYSE